MPNNVMIYDDACPMCQGYTSAFKKLGWSDRKAFSKLPAELLTKLDLDRARHEIPLLNLQSGEVKYGLDSQITVLSQGLPWLRPVLQQPLLKLLLKPVYGLITYNRRVIAGTRPPVSGFDCAPDFHLPWRIAYLLLAAILLVALGTLPLSLGGFTLAVVVISMFTSTERMDMAGNGITVILLGSLLAIWMPDGLVALVMGAELYRRFAR